MSILGFLKRGKTSAQPVPRTLSTEILEAVTGSCVLPDEKEKVHERRKHSRFSVGARVQIREARSDSEPISVLLRDISVASVGLLVDSPLPRGVEYWIYIPKAENPHEVLAFSCIIERCDPGGFELSAFVAAGVFVDGEPPMLETAIPAVVELVVLPPNQSEEEGGPPTRTRGSSSLFTPKVEPAEKEQPDAPPPDDQEILAVLMATDEPASLIELDPADLEDQELEAERAETAAAQPAVMETPTAKPADAAAPAAPEGVGKVQEPSKPTPLVFAEAAITETPLAEEEEEAPAKAVPLKPAQLKKMSKEVKLQRTQLKRLAARFDRAKLSPDDPRLQSLLQAERALEQLYTCMQPLEVEAPLPPPVESVAPPKKKTRKRSKKRRQTAAAEPVFFVRQSAMAIMN